MTHYKTTSQYSSKPEWLNDASKRMAQGRSKQVAIVDDITNTRAEDGKQVVGRRRSAFDRMQ